MIKWCAFFVMVILFIYGFYFCRLVVKMAFSRHPKARQMIREMVKLQEENSTLKRQISSVEQTKQHTTHLSTPERHATNLLNSVEVTPNQQRTQTLAPYCEIMNRIAEAPIAVKKELCSSQPASVGALAAPRFLA